MKDVQRVGRYSLGLILGGIVLLGPVAARAAGDVQDVNQLRAELQAQRQRQTELEDKINQWEARQKLKERALEQKVEQVAAQQEKPEEKPEAPKKEALPDFLQWVSRISLYGDFRYRYEYIDDQFKDVERNRNRIRARVGLNAKINDEWSTGLRLATDEGTQGGDPVSTNQTLGGAWSRKPVWLDLAFLDYHPLWASGLDLRAGKIPLPFYRPGDTQLIWDSDLTPEGAAVSYSLPLGDQTTMNVTGGSFWVVERSADVDTSCWGIQSYVKHKIDGSTYVLGGASGYWYPQLRGQRALSMEWEYPTANFFGNSNAGGVYTSNYDLVEAFGEVGTRIGTLPVALYGDYVVNTAAQSHKDTGWLIGASLNKAQDPGSWQLDYNYRDVQADAVVAQFNDSDFVGGGTGGRGHWFGLTYVLSKNVLPGLNYYLASYEGRNHNDGYQRVEADIMVKF